VALNHSAANALNMLARVHGYGLCFIRLAGANFSSA